MFFPVELFVYDTISVLQNKICDLCILRLASNWCKKEKRQEPIDDISCYEEFVQIVKKNILNLLSLSVSCHISWSIPG